MNEQTLLEKVADFYLSSMDFNGIAISVLREEVGIDELRSLLSNLIRKELVSVVYGDVHNNSHIRALPDHLLSIQIEKLDQPQFNHACVYPLSVST